MKEIAFKRQTELEDIYAQAHIAIDTSAARDRILSVIDSSMFEPSELLADMENQILKAKEEALSRKDILEKVDRWMLACEEESWLEDYSRDDNRYSATRGAHLNLKRAEKARVLVNKIPAIVDMLVAKTQAWEQEHSTAFTYDGVALLAMLDEYRILRQEKEEEKRRMRMAALQTAALLLLLLAVATKAAEPPQQERTALQAFLARTPHERKLGWNAPAAPSACLWFGVTCDADNATVVAVHLPGVGLVGSLPAGTLGTLASLRKLSLRSNRLSGPVPADIFSLPNLRSLYLQNNRLSGSVPPELAGLTALRHLALYDNELSGEIPAALDGLTELRSIRLDSNRLSGSLPSLSGLRRLELFNVSDNQLDGAIPASFASFPPESFAGNPGLCGEPLDRPCPVSPSKSKKKGLSGAAVAAIAVGVGAGALLALILLVLCCLACRRRDAAATRDNVNKTASTSPQDRGFTPSPVSGEMTDLADLTSSKDLIPVAGETTTRRLVFVSGGAGGYSFDLEDLLRASAEVLGKGAAGTTYRAVLEDGATVVVKRLKDVVAARREFASALEALGRVEHRNLLPVRAYYFSKDEKLLVADYLPAGSLAAALHGSRGSGRTPMDWDARMRSALCAARGMAHLHAAHGLAHGDVKSSNLLLRHGGDPGDAAALSDYSLQHLFAPSPPPSASPGGYRAPELLDPRRPTFMSDVYSIGVLFLEILTGKCPASGTAGGVDGGAAELDLPRWVQSVVREEWTAEVFDPELVQLGGGAEEEMVALLQVAMACAATAPDARPDATEVLKRVEEIGGGRHGRATTEEGDGSWGTPTGASPTGASP